MQKVKHLDYDQLNNCENEQVKAKLEMKEEKKHHAKQEEQNRNNKAQKKDEYIREDINNISETDQTEKGLQDIVENLVQDLELQKEALINNYETKME